MKPATNRADATETQTLTLHWSISKARDTEGYNVLTFRDARGAKIARANGGGYDLTGTCLADALETLFPVRMLQVATARAARTYHPIGGNCPFPVSDPLYGLTLYLDKDSAPVKASMDGACGVNSVENVATAMGLKLTWSVNRKGAKTAVTIEIVD